jgi:hypothetical protein
LNFGSTVFAASTLAKFIALHSTLEALAILLLTERFGAVAASSMRWLNLFLFIFKFWFEGYRVSGHYLVFSLLSELMTVVQVTAIEARTIFGTGTPIRETLTVKLEALCLFTVTWFVFLTCVLRFFVLD